MALALERRVSHRSIDPFERQLTGFPHPHLSRRNVGFLSAESTLMGMSLFYVVKTAEAASKIDPGATAHNISGVLLMSGVAAAIHGANAAINYIMREQPQT